MKLIEVVSIEENGQEKWSTNGDYYFISHSSDRCEGQYCSIHNPSDHPLNNAPYNWRSDRGIMERICKHGIGHNDPDDTDFRKRNNLDDSEGIHACCGCCIGVSYG